MTRLLVGVVFCASCELGEPTDLMASDDNAGLRTRVEVGGVLTPVWGLESDQTEKAFGLSVSSAGDVNGDGWDDVIVGAPGGPGAGGEPDPSAYVFHGSAAGMDAIAEWMVASDAGSEFGTSVATAGDVNGDGFDDVVVGADNFGRAFLYLGSGSGLATTEAWTAEAASGDFGHAVASAGDVNGDGYDDVAVGNPIGEVSVFHGSAAGLSVTADWIAVEPLSDFGLAVSSAGDVNDDGFADLVVGDPDFADEGKAYVFHGSGSGLEATAGWTVESPGPGGRVVGEEFGFSVSSAGDVNSDGYDDVVIGAYGFDVNGGAAYLYEGSAAGLGTIAAWSVEDPANSSYFGGTVSSAGDVNGDGFADVVVGAIGIGDFFEGRVYVYLGSAVGLGSVEAWIYDGRHEDGQLGTSVAGAGDVDGDGAADVIAGAPFTDHGHANEGKVYLFAGCVASGQDTDGDTISDGCDSCAGFDDTLDGDQDRVPDGCDICPFVRDPGQSDRDGDGLGDACVPLQLSVVEVSASGGLTATVENAFPSETVAFLLGDGPPEPGPCPPPRLHAGLCLDVGPHATWLVAADDDGRAVLTGAALPVSARVGMVVTVQAAADRRDIGGVKSEPVETTVAP